MTRGRQVLYDKIERVREGDDAWLYSARIGLFYESQVEVLGYVRAAHPRVAD